MAANHRPDGFEERRQPPLSRCTVEYHSPDLRRKTSCNHESQIASLTFHPHLERRTSSLHREADVLIQKRAAVAEDVEEYRVFVQPLVGDHLQQSLADVWHLVSAPEQAFYRRRVTQRDATVECRQRQRSFVSVTH